MSTIKPNDLPEYLTLREAAFFCAGKWPEGKDAPLGGAVYFLDKFNKPLFNIQTHIISAMSNGALTKEKIIALIHRHGEIALAFFEYFFSPEEVPPEGVKIFRPRHPKDLMGFMTYCELPKSIVEDFLRRNGIRSGVFFPERVATAIGQGEAVPEKETDTSASPVENIFRKDGDSWLVSFGGKTCHIGDSRGMGYIHYLLQKPRYHISALELSQLGASQITEKMRKSGNAVFENTDGSAHVLKDPILTSTTLANLLRRKQELEAKQDHQRSAEDSIELSEITGELEANTKPNGKSRLFSDDSEKARKAVSAAIARAIDAIRPVNSELSLFFQQTIETGANCIYKSTDSFNL